MELFDINFEPSVDAGESLENFLFASYCENSGVAQYVYNVRASLSGKRLIDIRKNLHNEMLLLIISDCAKMAFGKNFKLFYESAENQL